MLQVENPSRFVPWREDWRRWSSSLLLIFEIVHVLPAGRVCVLFRLVCIFRKLICCLVQAKFLLLAIVSREIDRGLAILLEASIKIAYFCLVCSCIEELLNN